MAKRKMWSNEELMYLEALCGDRPWSSVVRGYNCWARLNGFPERTSVAMARKAQYLGMELRTQGQFITVAMIAQILGVNRNTPFLWVRKGLIPAFRNGTGRSFPYYVNRIDLRNKAKADPQFFRLFPHERLVLLFSSAEVADLVYQVDEGRRDIRMHKKPVRCVETGRRYESIRAAAKACYVTPARLGAVLDTHECANNYHWISCKS